MKKYIISAESPVKGLRFFLAGHCLPAEAFAKAGMNIL